MKMSIDHYRIVAFNFLSRKHQRLNGLLTQKMVVGWCQQINSHITLEAQGNRNANYVHLKLNVCIRSGGRASVAVEQIS